jgi:hypothetical protein
MQTYCYRSMRTFNFTLLAVFSCIAMIAAAPPGIDRVLAEALDRRQAYVV